MESTDDDVLEKLDKQHTAADLRFVVERCRDLGLAFAPTFVAFTPWTTLKSYADMLAAVADLELVGAVSPIQYAIRLLIPRGSRLLELDEVRDLVEPFDEVALAYPWHHPDARVDDLQRRVLGLVTAAHEYEHARAAVFGDVCALARAALEEAGEDTGILDIEVRDPATIPYLTEPWYC